MAEVSGCFFLQCMHVRFNPLRGWIQLVVRKPWVAPTVIVVQALQAWVNKVIISIGKIVEEN